MMMKTSLKEHVVHIDSDEINECEMLVEKTQLQVGIAKVLVGFTDKYKWSAVTLTVWSAMTINSGLNINANDPHFIRSGMTHTI